MVRRHAVRGVAVSSKNTTLYGTDLRSGTQFCLSTSGTRSQLIPFNPAERTQFFNFSALANDPCVAPKFPGPRSFGVKSSYLPQIL